MEVVLCDGVHFNVSDTLDDVTSWCALEQEDWFEDEIKFLRGLCEPGWRVLDVGANHGVYSLTLAKAGAATVWALEPSSEPMTRLRQSVCSNEFEGRVVPLQIALSDRVGSAYMQLSTKSELRSLTNDCEDAEKVAVTTLDFFARDYLGVRDRIDFIKMDAEGEELAILRGGAGFWQQHSPLVMFELKHAAGLNLPVVDAFIALGFGIYMLVPGLGVLRPLSRESFDMVDPYLLNLFACRLDRAKELASKGFLIEASGDDASIIQSDPVWFSAFLELPCAGGTRAEWSSFDLNQPYGQAFLKWCGSRDAELPSRTRYELLDEAKNQAVALLATGDFHPASTVLAARVLADLGQRKMALELTKAIVQQLRSGDLAMDRPMPALQADFDHRSPQCSEQDFFYQSMLEYLVSRAAYSGFYVRPDVEIVNLGLASFEHSPEFERRAVLMRLAGETGLDQRISLRSLRYLFKSNALNSCFLAKAATEAGFYPYADVKSQPALLQEITDELETGVNGATLIKARRLVELDFKSVAAHFNLGCVLAKLDRHSEAVEAFRKALVLQADDVPSMVYMGVSLTAGRQYGEAEIVFRECLANHPENYLANYHFASCLVGMRRFQEAVYYLRHVIRLNPGYALGHDLLACTLISLSRTREAIPVLQQALVLDPQSAQSWNSLGRCYFMRGQLDDAESCYLKALTLRPDFLAAWSNSLMIQNYREVDSDRRTDHHKKFDAHFCELYGDPKTIKHRNEKKPGRRLRIGFVSGDFRRHSVGYFIYGTLKYLDRNKFQLFGYYNDLPDERTAEFRAQFHVWRDVIGVGNRALVELVRKDKIDVLFDLSGHTSGHRLDVFAQKAAPLQISWIGYPATTGLSAIDYRLTDAVTDPLEGAIEYHSEKLWRLPECFLNYTPPVKFPDVAPLPCFMTDSVTFGSFNTLFKISDETLRMWVAVLTACLNATLVVKAAIGLADQESRQELLDRFAVLGIAEGRVIIEEVQAANYDHLDRYKNIDIALDTFPYNGTTTTCEALWMGVPVVTRMGGRHVSRVGASLLGAVGLEGLVANGFDDYVQIAVDLASDREQLAELRRSMRQRLSESVLLDAPGMAKKIEAAVLEMWEDHVFDREENFCAPELIFKKPLIKLHIGGEKPLAGWKVLNAVPGPYVDYLADVRDLSAFEDECCKEIYCSHVLEHLDQGEILPVLNSLFRILVTGGKLYISVPDMDTLVWLFASPQLDDPERFHVMRMIFGGQSDAFDYHYIGLNERLLRAYLKDVGASSVTRVELFGLLEDSSALRFGDILVSLNIVAVK